MIYEAEIDRSSILAVIFIDRHPSVKFFIREILAVTSKDNIKFWNHFSKASKTTLHLR